MPSRWCCQGEVVTREHSTQLNERVQAALSRLADRGGRQSGRKRPSAWMW